VNPIRVELPASLRTLAGIQGDIHLTPASPATLRTLLDALETRYPPLRGTLRDQQTGQRRPFIRFFACAQDLSHQPPDTPLPAPVRAGTEPLLIVGAIAGG
jgi:molybdopterin converting factor small subunit